MRKVLQKKLKTIVSNDEYLFRKAVKQKNYRKEKGGVTREEYLMTQKKGTEELKQKILSLKNKGLKQIAIAKELSLSAKTITRHLRQK